MLLPIGGNNVSFEINFRENKTFMYVHYEMALLKKKKVYLFIITSIIYLFFCDEILLAVAAESLFNS